MFSKIDHRFDCIVSNPPYIATHEIAKLESEVKDYEPMGALDGFEDGLFFYRVIAKEAKQYLKQSGKLYLEIGYDQGEAVSALLKENGFKNVHIKKDFAGLDRVCYGWL